MIEHVFVLMLENRSFDHMLGLSGIGGVDGLTGNESNPAASGVAVRVEGPAAYALDVDPKHGFVSVVEQLCGRAVVYPAGGPYPPIKNSGFALSCIEAYGLALEAEVPTMRAYSPTQLPVLHALANEFAVCDRWFSSLPGPTWPNRFFAHAASSAGLDDSPSPLRSATAVFAGYHFANGTIFDLLERNGHSWCVVEGGALPVSLAMEGMIGHAINGGLITFDEFCEQLRAGTFSKTYTFIEPHYGHILLDGSNFKCGNSQHPLDDVTRGERLVKAVYEAIRGSTYWDKSLLMILYDEHGGFYDHVPPPPAVAPADAWTDISNNSHGFAFDQLGVRTPAVIVSPYIERGVVDHTVYDHTSIIATLSRLFNLGNLTRRDAAAASLGHLLSGQPRSDTPPALPEPADSKLRDCEGSLLHRLAGEVLNVPGELAGQPLEETLVGFLHIAMLRDVHLAAIEGTHLLTAIEMRTRDLAELLDRVGSQDSMGSKLHAARYIRSVEKRYETWRGINPALNA
jgi:phospholipase C